MSDESLPDGIQNLLRIARVHVECRIGCLPLTSPVWIFVSPFGELRVDDFIIRTGNAEAEVLDWAKEMGRAPDPLDWRLAEWTPEDYYAH
jgi:hypothetical protein